LNEFVSVEAKLLDGDARARSRGDNFYRTWRRWTEAKLDELFFEMCQELGVKTLIECGAHGAEASARFIARSRYRTAIALEANPFTFRKKTSRVRSRRIIALNEGLGAEVGRLSLRIPDKDGTGNRVSPMASFLDEVNVRPKSMVDVPVTTIDEICSRFGPERPIALWVDVEGYGGQVLKGAEEVLDGDVVVVLIEASNAGHWVGETSASAVQSKLEAAGLTLIARDCAKSDNTQYNMLFIRRDNDCPSGSIATYLQRALRPVDSKFGSRMLVATEAARKRRAKVVKRARRRLIRAFGLLNR